MPDLPPAAHPLGAAALPTPQAPGAQRFAAVPKLVLPALAAGLVAAHLTFLPGGAVCTGGATRGAVCT